MSQINSVVINGNLTSDPELKTLRSGTKVCEFGIAHNSRKKNAQGEYEDYVSYFDVAVYGNQIWSEISFFGVTLQKAMLYWSLGTIVFGIARNMQRVGMKDGFRAVLPALGVIAFGVAILEGAQVGALSTVTAVTLATAVNVYFATRMLTFRLHGRAPGDRCRLPRRNPRAVDRRLLGEHPQDRPGARSPHRRVQRTHRSLR